MFTCTSSPIAGLWPHNKRIPNLPALDQWYRLCKKAGWRNFAELRALFPSTYKVGDMFVFDIGGNKLLLIAAIHFNARRVFIRAVLTHKEYDQGDWK